MNGNCIAQDETNILFTPMNTRTQVPLQAYDIQVMKKHTLEEHETIIRDHEYITPIHITFSEISENVVSYVAGYAVNMTKKLIKCPICIKALHNSHLNHSSLKLLQRKGWGL